MFLQHRSGVRPFRRQGDLLTAAICWASAVSPATEVGVLESRRVYSNTLYKRRLFYVGASRAKRTLSLIVSRDNASPLPSI
jgi:hypothetical protein